MTAPIVNSFGESLGQFAFIGAINRSYFDSRAHRVLGPVIDGQNIYEWSGHIALARTAFRSGSHPGTLWERVAEGKHTQPLSKAGLRNAGVVLGEGVRK